MLLKVQTLERLVLKQTEINKKSEDYIALENQLAQLYTLGYREMPIEMQQLFYNDSVSFTKDYTPKGFQTLEDKTPYITLSNGKFEEVHTKKAEETYFNTVIDTKTTTIKKIAPKLTAENRNTDLVVFALSIDPLYADFVWNSPYAFSENRVIDAIELEGTEALRVTGLQYLNDGRVMIKIVPDDQVKNNASSSFQIRYPANLIRANEDKIFTTDDFGNADFGYKEVQKKYGNGVLSKQDGSNNLLVNGELKAYAVHNPTTGGDNYTDVVVGAIITESFTPNSRVLVDVPITNNFDGISSDFGDLGSTVTHDFVAPFSTTDVTFNVQVEDFDGQIEENYFTVIGADGNQIGATISEGVLTFTIESEASFSIQVTGNTGSTGDLYEFSGSVTTTEKAEKIEE